MPLTKAAGGNYSLLPWLSVWELSYSHLQELYLAFQTFISELAAEPTSVSVKKKKKKSRFRHKMLFELFGFYWIKHCFCCSYARLDLGQIKFHVQGEED